MDDERTSEYFSRQIFEGMGASYPNHAGEWVEGEEFDRRSEIVSLLVKCRESITQGSSSLQPLDEFVEEHRDRAEDWLDSYYSCIQLGNVPDMVRRTLQFSKLDAATIPSEQTALYISEASRAYIHGLLLSSVAMARCALEQALKDGFARSNEHPAQNLYLRDLIKLAERTAAVLSPSSIGIARDMVYKCNTVMHSSPVRNEHVVLEILVGIRGLLREIYSPEGGAVF
jgi:hypothetical protein